VSADGAPPDAQTLPFAPVPARVRWAVAAGARVLRAMARTWRVREIGREGWNDRRARKDGGTVVAIWHGQMLPLTAHHRDEGVSVLISEHRDGEIIARVTRAFGFGTVRGSTSRGGSRALLELVSVLRRGGEIALTPDGPRGPRHTFAPGALVAANRAGVPVVCVVAHVDRAWQLGSWDRFEIPKPFARITVAYSEPTYVPGKTPREAADAVPMFKGLMTALRARAETAARGTG
jgi:lysophospholipid acyltransferase (LPLAT)-like uncharacterized protein